MSVFHLIKEVRRKFVDLLETLSIEQINQIPTGFRNNIIWNFGHAIVATQSILFKRTGKDPAKEIVFLEKYQSGSVPDSFIGQAEVDTLKKMSEEYLIEAEILYHKGFFSEIDVCKLKTFSVETDNIDELLQVILMHETLHYGIASAMKRWV